MDENQKELTHINNKGSARMVDVSAKPITLREATARGRIYMNKETLNLINENKIAKGNVLETAKLAGIMAAKRTGTLIPLCHPLNLTSVDIDFKVDQKRNFIDILATVKCSGPTGVEMEAMTAVSIAALTIYDMCKAVDREMIISDIMLLEKKGGKSGHWKRK